MLIPEFLAANPPATPIGTLVHVGAHHGEGLRRYAALRPQRIVWVEADPETFAELSSRMAELAREVCPDVEVVCLNALVADEDGRTESLREFSNDGASTSIFSATDVLRRRWPTVEETGRTASLPTSRLDTLLETSGVNPDDVDVLVLDVQGAEALCMTGAPDTLAACRYLEVEVSLEPIYEGGALFPEVEALAVDAGLVRVTPVPWHGDVVYARQEPQRRPPSDPGAWFRRSSYIRHNARRLEHLASLALPLHGRTVLELGAGVGDHTPFYLDRGCRVTCVESRPENLALLRQHLSDDLGYTFGVDYRVVLRNLDEEGVDDLGSFDVVHCYGLLYHLERPYAFLDRLAPAVRDLLLLETAVSYSAEDPVGHVKENPKIPTQAMGHLGSRPDRAALFSALTKHFPHVSMPTTQPCHEQFPTDWTLSDPPKGLSRAVFVASRSPLDRWPSLTPSVPDFQDPAL